MFARRLFSALIFILFGTTPVPASDTVPMTILFLGDSLTEGYQVPRDASFPTLVQAMLEADLGRPVEIINGGVSGSTTASGLQRLEWYLKRKPDLMLLALGANDGLRGQPVASSRANLLAIIDRGLAEGMTVALAGMRMPPNYGPEYTRDFEQMFADIAAERSLPFLPFLLDGVAADRNLLLPDGIHPNAAGYRIIADTVFQFLRPLVSSSN